MSEMEIISPNYWDERVLQTQIFRTRFSCMLSRFTISNPSIDIVPRSIFGVSFTVILTRCVCAMSFFDGYSVRCSTRVPSMIKLSPSTVRHA
jgi:hypothetical protein